MLVPGGDEEEPVELAPQSWCAPLAGGRTAGARLELSGEMGVSLEFAPDDELFELRCQPEARAPLVA